MQAGRQHGPDPGQSNLSAVRVPRQDEVDVVVGQVVEGARIVEEQEAQVPVEARVRAQQLAQVGVAVPPHEVGADDLHGAGLGARDGRRVDQQLDAVGRERGAHLVGCFVVVVPEHGITTVGHAAQGRERALERAGRRVALHREEVAREQDEVGVAILGAARDRDFDRELARFPEVVARLAGAAPVDGVRGAGPFWQSAKRPAAERVALVGDAAGYTDAVTGEGISLAIRGAEALARIFAESDGVVGYDRAWRGITREHRAFAALLRLAVDHPGSRRAAFRALARMPWFFEVLLRRAGEVARALAAFEARHPGVVERIPYVPHAQAVAESLVGAQGRGLSSFWPMRVLESTRALVREPTLLLLD